MSQLGTTPAKAADSFSVGPLLQSIRNTATPKVTGWPELDALDVRLHPGELNLIGARTGHGKTTALINLLTNWLEVHPDQAILFYSYEIPLEAIFVKMAGLLMRKQSGACWPFYGIKDYLREHENIGRGEHDEPLAHAIDTIGAWSERCRSIYCPQWTVEQVAKHAHDEAANGVTIGAVLVDYLQLVKPPPGNYERRDVEISQVARRLKQLSIELSCPLIAAAQLGREAIASSVIPPGRPFESLPVQEAIRMRRPQLHHLSEAGSEQEADLVLGLLNYRADFVADREDTDMAERAKPSPLDVLVLKNRYGNLGAVSLVLEGESGYIRGLSFRESGRHTQLVS